MAPLDTLLIRADAGGDKGIGHVMRMIALAQAWQDYGGSVEIVCATCPVGVEEKIREENIIFTRIENKSSNVENDIRALLHQANARHGSWIVLDGYHFDLSYQKAIKDAGYNLLCVDDYGHCDRWLADMVLNQNLHAPEQKQNYQKSSPNCRFLFGSKYILLRREFYQAHETNMALSKQTEPARLLITFGGVDPENWTELIVKQVLDRPLNAFTTVVLGAGNPHIQKIKKLVESADQTIQIVQNVSDMAKLIRNADCIVSAAGSSAYEWLRYRLPALVFVIADNQKPLAPYLSRIQYIEVFSNKNKHSCDRIKSSLERLVNSGTRKYRTPSIVDAQGASRVVRAMLSV